MFISAALESRILRSPRYKYRNNNCVNGFNRFIGIRWETIETINTYNVFLCVWRVWLVYEIYITKTYLQNSDVRWWTTLSRVNENPKWKWDCIILKLLKELGNCLVCTELTHVNSSKKNTAYFTAPFIYVYSHNTVQGCEVIQQK